MTLEVKQLITEVLFLIGATAPLYHLVMQLLRHERTTALKIAELTNKIEFAEQRLDRIDSFIAGNSGFRLK